MQALILGLIIVIYLIDVTVTIINDRHSRQPLPEHARGIYDDAQYNRWLAYSLANLRHSLLAKTVLTGLLLVLLASGTFGWLERLTSSWFQQPLLQTLAFLGAFGFLNFIISLPFNYYRIFVIEEQFGFNKTTHRTFILDMLKSIALAIVLGGGVISLLFLLYTTFSEQLWLFILAAWATLSLIIVVLFALNTRIFVKLFNKLTPLPEGELRDEIEALARQAGFEVRAISVMDASKRSSKLNAFFSGLGRTREVVLFDTLLEKLKKEQILSVLAHELGHAVHKDVPRLLGMQIVVLAIYAVLIGLILQTPALAQAFGLSGVHFGFSLVLFGILAEPLDLLLSFPVNAISRRAEYAADAFAARLAGTEPTASALLILAQENLANLNPHPLYVLLHYTHPPIPERLRAINRQA
ncbi:MAG: M48 family metallopeptidase [Anaerolineales bacterium]|nr:M48 family metallopeptidase [Anaerolineales bacterium]MDW8279303.1 M48 family metallopeptidase [Anaerolineales bacterium]